MAIIKGTVGAPLITSSNDVIILKYQNSSVIGLNTKKNWWTGKNKLILQIKPLNSMNLL